MRLLQEWHGELVEVLLLDLGQPIDELAEIARRVDEPTAQLVALTGREPDRRPRREIGRVARIAGVQALEQLADLGRVLDDLGPERLVVERGVDCGV